MNTKMILTAVALLPFLIVAIDLFMAQKHYRERGVTGGEYLKKWFKRRRLALTGVVVLYLAGAGVFFGTNLVRLPGLRHESNQYVESAAKYLKEKRYSEAVIELRNAIRQNPEDSEAHLVLARTLIRLGQGNEALEVYRKVLSLDAKQYDAHLELGGLAFALKNPELAGTEAQEAARLQPDKVEPHLLLARIYSATGKREQAMEQCRTVIGKEFATSELRQQLVMLLLQNRAFDEALQAIATGLKAAPDNHALKYLQSEALLGLGRSAEAEAVLRAIAAGDPASAGPYIALGNLRMQTHDYIGALKEYDDALQRAPDNDLVMNNVASLNAEHGFDMERSAALAARMHAKHPKDPAVADTLGWTLLRQGKLEQALPLLQQGAAGMPGNPVHRYHLGAALLRVGELNAGKRELAEALKISKSFDGAEAARSLLEKRS